MPRTVRHKNNLDDTHLNYVINWRKKLMQAHQVRQADSHGHEPALLTVDI